MEAADGERRRLERNLHDGAQQRLIALTVALADDPVAAPLVDRFVGNLPKRVADLRDAEALQDYEGLATQAHQMMGSAGSYGFPRIGQVAARIEVQAKRHARPEVLAKTLKKFGVLCEAAIRSHQNLH